jgi:hypothetical protein
LLKLTLLLRSAKRQALVDWVMRGQRDDFRVEGLNINVGSGNECFPRALVESFWLLPRCTPTNVFVRHIFVAVDPANGTHRQGTTPTSEFAVVALWYNEIVKSYTICGLDSYPVREPEDWIARLRAFILQIRAHPEFRSAKLICAPENLTGTEAGWIRRVFQETDSSVRVMRENEWRTGLPSTAQSKRDMMVVTRQRMEQNMLRLAPDAQIACTGVLSDTLKEFKRQMLAYAEVRKPPLNPADPVRVRYTGKANGRPDDLSTMAQFAVYAAELFFRTPVYRDDW